MKAFAGETPHTESAENPARVDRIRVSVLVFVTYEPEPLAELYADLADVIEEETPEYEFIFLIAPEFAERTGELSDLVSRGAPIQVLQMGQDLGETSLLRVGARACRGSVILTTPAYRQVESSALVTLFRAVENGCDVAIARRWPRRDSWFNQTHTRLFRTLAVRVAGAGGTIKDLGCGVRAIRRGLLEEIPLHGDLALFIPLLAAREGYEIAEVAAPQHPADLRTRVHSPFAYLRRLFDLLGLFFLLRFTEKPLRFFGAVGAGIVIPGIVILGIVFLQRLYGQSLADRPLLLLGVLLVVLGIQAIALGLIGEIIVHLHASERQSYRIRSPDSDP